jgi:hypothetical protein
MDQCKCSESDAGVQEKGEEEFARASQRSSPMPESKAAPQPKETGIPFFLFPDFMDAGRKQIEAMLDMQSRIFETFNEMNKTWLVQAKSEADLASEFMAKLTEARSIPDAAKVCQDCAGRQMEMMADQTSRFFAANEKVFGRFLHNGGASVSS